MTSRLSTAKSRWNGEWSDGEPEPQRGYWDEPEIDGDPTRYVGADELARLRQMRGYPLGRPSVFDTAKRKQADRA